MRSVWQAKPARPVGALDGASRQASDERVRARLCFSRTAEARGVGSWDHSRVHGTTSGAASRTRSDPQPGSERRRLWLAWVKRSVAIAGNGGLRRRRKPTRGWSPRDGAQRATGGVRGRGRTVKASPVGNGAGGQCSRSRKCGCGNASRKARHRRARRHEPQPKLAEPTSLRSIPCRASANWWARSRNATFLR